MRDPLEEAVRTGNLAKLSRALDVTPSFPSWKHAIELTVDTLQPELFRELLEHPPLDQEWDDEIDANVSDIILKKCDNLIRDYGKAPSEFYNIAKVADVYTNHTVLDVALHASLYHYYSTLEPLIKNLLTYTAGQTLLHKSIEEDSPTSVHKLLEYGVRPTGQALELVIQTTANLNVLMDLIRYGAPVTRGVLQTATTFNNTEILDILKSYYVSARPPPPRPQTFPGRYYT